MKLSAQTLNIPFKVAFSHAQASRKKTETLLVSVKTKLGQVGYGEGCPRSYVTGESIDSALAFFNDYKYQFSTLTNLSLLKSWVANEADLIDANPAAWCAVECAILDALAREGQLSIESLLGLNQLEEQFLYSAVLGSESLNIFKKMLAQYQKIGFVDYKLKISGDLNLDRKKVNIMKSLGINNIRLDGNNIWVDAHNAIKYIRSLNHQFKAIEEPIGVQDFKSMITIHEALKLPIILDESFLNVHDFALIPQSHKCWIVNLRISKMGGILRSLVVAKLAREQGIKLVIGSQVGETSILTRAALTIVNDNLDNLVAQEGAFGTYLLHHDVTNSPIMFGKNAQLSTNDFSSRPGFGIDYEHD